MIISKTPLRISFFGGGTDFADFFNEYGGSVISSTIDKYCYVIVRELESFFSYSSELSYSKIERVNKIEEIEHPSIKQAMKMLDIDHVRLTYEADLPARSGLGTSSAFAVGMLNGFHTLNGENVRKKQLADEAIHLERDLCNEIGGWQDQIAASFGGFNRINFSSNEYTIRPIIMSPERKKELNSNLCLFFTGFTRFSSDVHKENKLDAKTKSHYLQEMLKLVDEGEEILVNPKRELDDFGKLLNKTWLLKKQTGSNITTKIIDSIYERAISTGALGGKLLGAGGGGFFLFYVNRENKQKLIDELKELIYVPFEFEEDGTKIIYNSKNSFLEIGK